MTGIFFSARNCCTTSDGWLGALSWCRNHCPCLPLLAPLPPNYIAQPVHNFYFVILFYLQSVLVHSANCVKTCIQSVHVTFTTRRATCPPVHINDVQMPQKVHVKYLGLHLDRRLTWYPHIFTKRKQLGISLAKMYWLIRRKSKLSISNTLLIYKAILNPSGRMTFNSGARPQIPTSQYWNVFSRKSCVW
jgi:hypothetical protein